jgi:hypothetical protein
MNQFKPDYVHPFKLKRLSQTAYSNPDKLLHREFKREYIPMVYPDIWPVRRKSREEVLDELTAYSQCIGMYDLESK